jgi:hypothetical protein
MKTRQSNTWTTWVGIVAMATAALWSIVASTLSAHGLITVSTELSSYFPCFVGCVVGMFLYLLDRPGFDVKGLSRLAICVGFLLSVVIFWWGLGAKSFAFWKARMISPVQWAAMSGDLEGLITKLTPETARTGSPISRTDVPESLHALGLSRECRGGFAYRRDEETMVYVRYGNKVRSWGLFLGTKPMVRRQFPQCRVNEVSPNAFFFIGSYD